jgi:hypothetical protein
MAALMEASPKLFEKADIISMFNDEFVGVKDKFNDVIQLTLDKAEDFRSDASAKPGVYVFWKDRRVWKVGRHLVNSRMRATEHVNVPAEKKYALTQLKNDPDAHLLLFNVKEHDVKNGKDFRHWVAALEIFFELRLDPLEKSGRLG